MNRLQIEALLKEVSEGRTGVNDALVRLRDLPFEDLGFAKVDHHRALRTGMPEVIFAEGKTTAQVAAIFSRMAQAGGNVLATRVTRAAFDAVAAEEPRAKDLLGVPEPYAIAAVVPLGKPVRQVTKLRRQPVPEFVTRERFDGAPFSG